MMDGRVRSVTVRFRVTEAERKLIAEKMKLLGTDNLSAYMRKMAIDGYIINADYTDLKAVSAELQKIGVNINQIAKRVHTFGSIYAEDIRELKEAMSEIWRLQRLSLLKAR